MLEPKDTITLTIGSRALTILSLRGRFIGLIDGSYYVNVESAEAAVAALIRIALHRPDRVEMKKKHLVDGTEIVRAAQAAVGDTAQDANLTDAERAVIEEVRTQLPRPSVADIKETARRLAQQN